MKEIPSPTVERLSMLYAILERLKKEGVSFVSSKRIGEIMGISSYTVRKDVRYISYTGSGSGYLVSGLKESITDLFGLGRVRNACIVGLGRLGCAIMNFCGYMDSSIRVVAGFDSNINVVETVDAYMPVYPAIEIPERVKQLGIEIGVLTVPPEQAQMTAERLIKGGVKGIMNFAPAVIKVSSKDITIKNIHMMEEFRVLSIMMDLKEKEK